MKAAQTKPIIGILGGICSGKSTVASELARLGCGVIDADCIAHKVLDAPEIKQKITSEVGQEILDSQGRIDRKKLADVVFGSREMLKKLNSIIHPQVFQRAQELIEVYNKDKKIRAIVLDMPLLLEVGWEKRCQMLVFVDCEAAIRGQRAKKSKNLDRKQLKKREKFQISLDKKKTIADYIIRNNSDPSALAEQIASVFHQIVNK